MATDPVVAPALVPARPINPDLTLWLLSIAHAVNHAQAVLLPLIYLRIIAEFGVTLSNVAYIATAVPALVPLRHASIMLDCGDGLNRPNDQRESPGLKRRSPARRGATMVTVATG